MILAAVSVGDLVELVWVSTSVTLVIITAFALGIRAAVRAAELRREGHRGAAAVRAVVATACYLLVGAATVAGVLVIAAG